MDKRFPRGVEIVTGAIIERDDKKILLTRSPKWNNKWALPGGHIETGETIVHAAVREGEEETGLKLEGISITGCGELIDDHDFHRPAHFVYFDVYCRIISGEVKLDKSELSQYEWVSPEEALQFNLIASDLGSIKRFIEFLLQQEDIH